MSGAKLVAAIVAAVALIALVAAAYVNQPPARSPQGADSLNQALDPQWHLRTKGDSTAPVTIYEMSDFQCPWCRQFADSTFPIIDQEYIATGKVRIIFVNFPIPSLHPNAPAAHEFAMCAADQGLLWPVHDILFREQDTWNRLDNPAGVFLDIAAQTGVDSRTLADCLEAGEMRMLIAADVNTAMRAGVTSTPTFVVRPTFPPGEAVLIPGAAGIDVWRPLLDSLVATKMAN